VPDEATVHAIVPLALLEAIRNLDTPLDDGLAELASETVSRRLGMSSTVSAQIGRYREAAAKGAGVSLEEATQVFRLAGRRADANLVFADAGRRAARLAGRQSAKRAIGRLLPRSIRRALGQRAAVDLSTRVFDLPVVREGAGVGLRLTSSLATTAGYAGSGCYFYSALLGELLRVTSEFEGAMIHDQCLAKGDGACIWRAAEAEAW
jgi:hypothetical protein